MTARIKGAAILAFPPHPDNCEVCGDTGRVRWCAMWRRQGGDYVSSYLGMPGSCLPLPILDVPFRVDVPAGGDAA